MVYCSKCGRNIKDDTEFCIYCGDHLKVNTEEKTPEKKSEDIKEEIKDIGEKLEKKIEDATETLGKKAEDVGKRIEKRFKNVSKSYGSWYNRNFGIFGPLISSFLGLIILRLIIGIMSYIGKDIQVIKEIGDFLLLYILWFFGLMLLSSYNTYFYSKYKKKYRWISPFFSALEFAVSLWIGAKILVIIDNNLDIILLSTIAEYIDTYLVLIFILVILIGYIYHLFMLAWDVNSKK
jgi:hypothetical protein